MTTSFELAGHVVGIMVDEDVDQEYLDKIHGIIEKKLAVNDKINLFCEIMPNNEVPLKYFLRNIRFKFEHSDQINRLAMVTDLNWVRGFMDVDNFFVSTEVKSFELKDRLEAIQWISM
ncbi:STAS/SEC14 domain-containing protein [Christiangramia sabulilitoris]|uniref:STAS/SEC14 domain-containing protein n=1 Tax=Christiangramia sabulilitoris TaxID=2583991 RepID=A0A550I815_9FLAO|nr:STAS/SEC14 domain-containing protein [Christiangramia sabulilitoris]TRO67115.1 STAS/SEC14 domain-containing protein [Christiangramia sabulilitoris]